jgi:hypothetical protein
MHGKKGIKKKKKNWYINVGESDRERKREWDEIFFLYTTKIVINFIYNIYIHHLFYHVSGNNGSHVVIASFFLNALFSLLFLFSQP